MVFLNFPEYSFNIKTVEGKRYIFDSLRKKFVALQPEELVRQNMVKFLMEERDIPASHIANEVSMNISGMTRRCDTLVFDADGKPLMVVEYKSPTVEITEKVFDQITMYNTILKVKYLLVSNGLQHICCKLVGEPKPSYSIVGIIPTYKEMTDSKTV